MSDPYKPSFYILDAWGRLPWLVRVRDLVLTVVIWCGYLYFMKDVLSFIHDAALWIYHGYDDPTQYPGLKSLPDIVALIKVGTLIGGTLIAWSWYNQLRYGKKKRRRFAEPVSIDEMAAAYHVNAADLAIWREQKVLIMHHDRDGHLFQVTEG